MSNLHPNQNSTWPVRADGFAVPYEVFLDPQLYAREQALIFGGAAWSFVGLTAEIPSAGDFKATQIGATPVIVTRDEHGVVSVMLNRCAHRGALVCREPRGNVRRLQCVYHQWNYDLRGRLRGVPFRGGFNGKGGMPANFELDTHNLQVLRVEVLHGLIFATASRTVESLEKYLGPMIVSSIARICGDRQLEVLGDQRQYMHGNWKLYAENTRDPYHASLLHLFHNTFGLYRSTQAGACLMDDTHRHTMLYAKASTSDETVDREVYKDVRSYASQFKLSDPSLLAGRSEFDDGITLVIMSIFPNLVIQQIANTLAVRQINTYGPNEFELVWTHFGYTDDDAEMRGIRLKQANLIGPAGLVSMEDGEAVDIVQKAIAGTMGASYLGMGGGKAEDAEHLVTESAIVGFWENYQSYLGLNV